MTQGWEVEPAAGLCAVTGRRLEEGEEFYSALFEDGEGFRRCDYSLDSWKGPPDGSYCHFKSRIPIKQKRKKLLVDNEILISFFLRLGDEIEPARLQFRFVLALILMRKRLLRYEGTEASGDLEVWRMLLTTDRSEHRVANPRLSNEQIEDVSAQLSAILHGDMGEWATANDRISDA